MTETSVPQRASRAMPRLPKVVFHRGQEADARAFLAKPPRSKPMRVRISHRALLALPVVLLGFPLGFVAAVLPAPASERWDLVPFGSLLLLG